MEIEDSIELITLFEIFYYFNGRVPLTNGPLPVPDRKTPDDSEKISIKTFYEIFKDKKSPRLFSLQIFFGGDISLSKDAITELMKISHLEL